jgi:hypothetical protein
MKGFWEALAVVAGLMVGFMWGDEAGFRAGERRAEQRQEVSRAEHNSMMRKIGVCSFAKVMAAQVECKNEFQPGEP